MSSIEYLRPLMEPTPPPAALPKLSELSIHQLGFVGRHFQEPQDLLGAPLLFTELNNYCSDLDANLLLLRRSITKRAVSWISRSFATKTSLRRLNHNLENLSLSTSQYGSGPRSIQKILGEELPPLVKELRRIESIRKYVDFTLKVEAVVGDLEDAVFYSVNKHRSRSSAKLPDSLIDSQRKQERLLQAMKSMNEIEEMLVGGVKEFKCQWHHLMESVDSRVDKALAVLRPQILADHRVLLASLGWPPKLSSSEVENGQMSSVPNPLVLMHVDKRERYSQSFCDLCALQHLQTRREERELNFFGHKKNDIGLWAIDELVTPIASRMEYHFTKWLEQPEFIFGLVSKITEDFIVGVDDVLQPLIDRARLVSYSAKEAWVSAMVHMLSVFTEKRLFPLLAERYKEKDLRSGVISSWLHLIDLIVAFDKRMESLINSDTCLFMGESERFGGFSRGLSVLRIFCDRQEWLQIWGKIELKDGWKKLKVELKDERVWLIEKNCGVHIGTESEQFLLSTREEFKAPLVAESVLKISWDIIERSQTFPAILARAQFIRLAAGRFLWHFFNVLILRGKRTEFILDNPNDDALMRICGSINAARYIESKLLEWSDDVNFSEMKIAENNSNIHNRDVRNETCFFWEEIKSLVELETNWLLEIIGVLLRQFESLCCDNGCFEQRVENTIPDRILRVEDLSVSMGFIEALDSLRSRLQFLKTVLNPKDFLDLWRSVAEGVDRYISGSIITSEIEFSSKVIDQFGVDMNAVFLVFQPFCVRPEAFFPCIRETLKLLTMSREEAKHLKLVRSNDASGIKCLRVFGVSHLSFDQVDRVLRKRRL